MIYLLNVASVVGFSSELLLNFAHDIPTKVVTTPNQTKTMRIFNAAGIEDMKVSFSNMPRSWLVAWKLTTQPVKFHSPELLSLPLPTWIFWMAKCTWELVVAFKRRLGQVFWWFLARDQVQWGKPSKLHPFFEYEMFTCSVLSVFYILFSYWQWAISQWRLECSFETVPLSGLQHFVVSSLAFFWSLLYPFWMCKECLTCLKQSCKVKDLGSHMIFAVVKSMCTKLQPSRAGSKKAWTWAHRNNFINFEGFSRTWSPKRGHSQFLSMNYNELETFNNFSISIIFNSFQMQILDDLDISAVAGARALHARVEREARDCWVDPDGGILQEFLAHSSSAQPEAIITESMIAMSQNVTECHRMSHNVKVISLLISFFCRNKSAA